MKEKDLLLKICCEKLNSKQITDFEFLKCQIAIEYLFENTTYEELVNKFFVSRSTVRRAINETAPEVLGSKIAIRLNEKGKYNKDNCDKTKKYAIYKVSDINLYGLEKILNEEIIEVSKNDLLILKAAYLFLLGISYSKISEELDLCKATISRYFNGKRVEELLKTSYLTELKNRLSLSKSSSSECLIKKR